MSPLRALSLILGVAVAANASAHHGIANFDFNKDVTISGTVAKLTTLPSTVIVVVVLVVYASHDCFVESAQPTRKMMYSFARASGVPAVSARGMAIEHTRASAALTGHSGGGTGPLK